MCDLWCAYWPWEDGVYLDVADNDNEEREEEDLSVYHGVVDGVPGLGVDPAQDVFCLVSAYIKMFLSEIFKEIYRSALIELLSWVLQHSEYDGLRWGTDQSEDPGTRNHQPSELTPILGLQKHMQ